MKFFVLIFCLVVVFAQDALYINWGACPEFEPTAEEQKHKHEVINTCLVKNPPPTVADSPTKEEIEDHMDRITTCALETDGWYVTGNKYDYERMRKEIQKKNLTVEEEILKKHETCRKNAEEKFRNITIPQVKEYQQCFDNYVTQICGIQIFTKSHEARTTASTLETGVYTVTGFEVTSVGSSRIYNGQTDNFENVKSSY